MDAHKFGHFFGGISLGLLSDMKMGISSPQWSRSRTPQEALCSGANKNISVDVTNNDQSYYTKYERDIDTYMITRSRSSACTSLLDYLTIKIIQFRSDMRVVRRWVCSWGKSRISTYILFASLGTFTHSTLGAEYPASLGPTAHFGVGFDRQTLLERGTCVTSAESATPIADAKGQGVSMEVLDIDNYRMLDQAMGVSSSLSLKYFDLGLSANFGSSNSIGIHKFSKFRLLRLSVTNSTVALKQPQFIDEVKTLLSQNSSDAQRRFRERCGTEYVHAYRTGGRFFVLIEIKSRTDTRSLSQTGGLGVQSPTVNVEVQGFSELLQTTGERKYSLTLLQVGGNSVPLKTNLEGLLEMAEKFPARVSEGPFRISFFTKGYETLSAPTDAQIWKFPYKSEIIEELSAKISEFRFLRSNILYVLQNPDEFEVSDTEKLIIGRNEVQNALNELRRIARNCQNIDMKCESGHDIHLPNVELPKRVTRSEFASCPLDTYKVIPVRGCGMLCDEVFMHTATPKDVCEELLSGANVNGKMTNGSKEWTPIHLAFHLGKSADISKLLINAGANLNRPIGNLGHTPLHFLACGAGDLEALRTFRILRNVSIFPEPHLRNRGGTPLHLAADCDRPGAIRELIALGAHPDAVDDHGNTPLHRAAVNGNLYAMQELVKAGADVNVRNHMGDVPLHHVGLSEKKEIPKVAEFLISQGARLDVTNDFGNSPLHVAVSRRSDLVMLLYDYGIRGNMINGEARLPLHIVAMEENWNRKRDEMVTKLANRRENSISRDKYGRTPWYYASRSAIKSSDTHILELLIRQGHTPNEVAELSMISNGLLSGMKKTMAALQSMMSNFRYSGPTRANATREVDILVRDAKASFKGSNVDWRRIENDVRRQAREAVEAQRQSVAQDFEQRRQVVEHMLSEIGKGIVQVESLIVR